MPKLIIDGTAVEVPEGTNVLEAAKKVGIVIPHFCYHPALGSVGACRLCAMTFLEGPVKGVQVACMVKAADGMVVSTTHGDAARLRRMVIEWLMLNHPHDCPVCDEGGKCLLQDYTIAGGHGIRRYKGKKRVFPDQYLGEFIYQEMNRCIQCYRCSRFYQDYCGGTDFGPLQISNKTFFGRYKEGWLESPFHGNLDEVCPTGVFTDKTYRYKSRPWDLETAPSVCPHCSLGCNTIPGARYRRLLKINARENHKVNGWFICDRGRFGYSFAGRVDRPHFPMLNREKAGHAEVALAAGRKIKECIEAYGPGSAAFVTSPRVSLEAMYALRRLAGELGAPICYSPDPARERKDRLAVGNLRHGHARSLKEVEDSDFMLVAGADPVNEAPMLALLMRQAARKGAGAVVLDPRPVRLPFEFTHEAVRPEGLADALSGAAADIPASVKRPTIIVGTDVGDYTLIDRAAEEVAKLRGLGVDCGLFYVLSGANSFGAALLAGDGGDFYDILAGVEAGRVKTLVAVGADPLGLYPNAERTVAAFGKLESLIVMDYLPSATARRADIFMPMTACAEEDGTFVNNEGRAQAYSRAYVSGFPINEMGPEPHPPREFSSDVPGHSLPAWEWAREVAEVIAPGLLPYRSVEEIRAEIAAEFPFWKALVGLDPLLEGAVLLPEAEYEPPDYPGVRTGGEGLLFLAVEQTFGTEELSTCSSHTQLRSPEAYILISEPDAERLALDAGYIVEAVCGGAVYSGTLMVDAAVAQGVAIAPRLPGTGAAGLSGRTVNIRKKEGPTHGSAPT